MKDKSYNKTSQDYKITKSVGANLKPDRDIITCKLDQTNLYEYITPKKK